jgi:CheY-like chemotaxis protein
MSDHDKTREKLLEEVQLLRRQLAEVVPPEEPLPVLNPAASDQLRETLLLAEDEDRVRALAALILRSDGYTVIEARSGKEALELSTAHGDSIHLLVTDVVMPEMSGTELAEQLRKQRPEVRVLFVSGYTDETVANHGVKGAFLPKPFTPTSLSQRVREVLDEPAPGSAAESP